MQLLPQCGVLAKVDGDHDVRHRAYLGGSLDSEQDPQTKKATIRKRLFLQFNGHECNAPTPDKILTAIQKAASQYNQGY